MVGSQVLNRLASMIASIQGTRTIEYWLRAMKIVQLDCIFDQYPLLFSLFARQ